MAEVVYPPRFHQRVLALEAPGGEPVAVLLVAPTIAAPGEPVKLKLAILDGMGYPSTRFEGAVRVRGPFARPVETEVRFKASRPAVAQIDGIAIGDEGLYRFEADWGGRVFFSNPTRCVEAPERRIYWGDPHVHTVLSACHPDRCRSLNFCYTAGRYVTGLDWVAAADHVSNGRCDFSKWKAQCTACNLYDDPPEFVTLPGYEASLKGGAGGDNNVYMLRQPEMFVDEYEDGNIRTICQKLSQVLGEDEFFVVPHHTTRTGKHGEISDDIYPGPERMPVVEVYSKWGASEYRGNPDPLEKVHPGPSYAVDLLNRGLRLGFIGGTDTHATMPSGRGKEAAHIDRLPAMTAVFAEGLTREAVFHGIQSRNCYATSGERIYLDVALAGLRPGQSAESRRGRSPRRIVGTVAGRSDIASVDIVRNGRTVHSLPGQSWNQRFDFTDDDDLDKLLLTSPHLGRFCYYYVRVTCASAARAWSSPAWLLGR